MEIPRLNGVIWPHGNAKNVEPPMSQGFRWLMPAPAPPARKYRTISASRRILTGILASFGPNTTEASQASAAFASAFWIGITDPRRGCFAWALIGAPLPP